MQENEAVLEQESCSAAAACGAATGRPPQASYVTCKRHHPLCHSVALACRRMRQSLSKKLLGSCSVRGQLQADLHRLQSAAEAGHNAALVREAELLAQLEDREAALQAAKVGCLPRIRLDSSSEVMQLWQRTELLAQLEDREAALQAAKVSGLPCTR